MGGIDVKSLARRVKALGELGARCDQGQALLYLMRLIDSNSLRLPLVAASPELSERLDATRKALDIYASHLFA